MWKPPINFITLHCKFCIRVLAWFKEDGIANGMKMPTFSVSAF